jgi:hypothetical protein
LTGGSVHAWPDLDGDNGEDGPADDDAVQQHPHQVRATAAAPGEADQPRDRQPAIHQQGDVAGRDPFPVAHRPVDHQRQVGERRREARKAPEVPGAAARSLAADGAKAAGERGRDGSTDQTDAADDVLDLKRQATCQ